MLTDAFETDVRRWGHRLAEHLPDGGRNPAAVAERRMMQAVIGDPQLRAALFRFVDVRPACRNRADLVRHLNEYLQEAAIESGTARRLSSLVGRRALELPTASAAAFGVAAMSHRFIAGEDAHAAGGELAALWERGRCVTLDLLGEATLTESEGDAYAVRCADTLRALTEMSAPWRGQRLLEQDGLGPLPRANLSVKVSALTPHLRANAPARALEAARERLIALLRLARDLGAHLHVDMESLDTRESITELVLELLSEPEFDDGPSAGIVLQGYLTDSEEQLDRLLRWLRDRPRAVPFTIRLVKGAYWDHEVVLAAQTGLGGAGIHRPPLLRPPLRAPDPAPARCACRGRPAAAGDRLPQPPLARTRVGVQRPTRTAARGAGASGSAGTRGRCGSGDCRC